MHVVWKSEQVSFFGYHAPVPSLTNNYEISSLIDQAAQLLIENGLLPLRLRRGITTVICHCGRMITVATGTVTVMGTKDALGLVRGDPCGES